MIAGSTLISTTALTRRYDGHVAVDRLDLSVAQGVIWGLLGPNGAGKSTLMKMLTTLLPPTSGRASVCGHDVVREASQVRRRIGYLPQMVSADGALTGYENLLLYARLCGVPRDGRRERIDQALDFMGIGAASRQRVATYSGGMIRRLELAQALMHRPAVLFLDEPTIGLDPIARQSVWDLLRDVRAEFGVTVCLTTHDLEEADYLCDQLVLLHRGRVVAEGTPVSLKGELGPDATLGDVFSRHAGGADDKGSYRDARRARRTARRLR